MESPVRRNLKRKCSDVAKSDTAESKETSPRRKLSSTRMQKTPVAGTSKTPASTRTANATPKKKSVNKGLKGQKWFKGTPKSRSNHRMRPSQQLLKSSPQDNAPQAAPLPPSIVEFDFDGVAERLHVLDSLIVCNKEPDDQLPGTSRDLQSSSINPPVTPSQQHITWSASLEKKGARSGGSNSTKGKSNSKSKSRSSKKLDQSSKKRSSTTKESQELKNQPKLPEAVFSIIKDFKMSEAPKRPNAYIRYIERPLEELAEEVEYDLDEEDCAWLEVANAKRRSENLSPVCPESMELLMDRLEKESYFQMQSSGMDQGPLIDDDAVCCICMDGECQNSNAILFCDMCNLAVHQECYGVPYIPEGQWLCRRCIQSPSRAVDCALCPNKGGAFKQTDDGRWAHVVCAIWIPEVCFANTVFLEPIDSINNIPPARWKLCCYVCKQKNVGACIQCHKSNCYTAFHVTCAQQADLCMKMDTVRQGSSVIVKKTAYCDNHAPPEVDSPSKEGDQSPRQKMRQTRKLLAEKRCAIPVVSIPTIPIERIDQILSNVTFKKKKQFVKRLMAYWKLKRSCRNGVPLLRRLQVASLAPRPAATDASSRPIDPSEMAANQAYYQYFMRLRQNLERARLLCELIRKREKYKIEEMNVHSKELNLKLRPFTIFLLKVVDEIASKDSLDIFAEPVDLDEVTDYLTVIKQPMDLSTMREKVDSFQYNSVEELETDFNLMIDNCLKYNSKETIFHRAAVKLKELGGIILRHAKRDFLTIGYDPSTGMHLLERPSIPEVLTDREIVKEVEGVLDDKGRFAMDQDKHIAMLEDILDKTLSLTHPVTKKNRYARIKQEIVRVKRMYEQKDTPATPKGTPVQSPKKRIIKRDRRPVTETPTSTPSESPTKGKSAYDFELSDECENSISPDITSDAWRKRFPTSKSVPTLSNNDSLQNHQSISPKGKDKDKSVSTESSPNTNKRALRPPKQKTPPVSPPNSTTTKAVNTTPKRTTTERKSPVAKNLAVTQFVTVAINKSPEKLSTPSPNKTPNVGRLSSKPKTNSETGNASQYTRREQKEMRAAQMTHQKVSLSMALAAAQQITYRDIGDVKDRSSTKCKPLLSMSPTGVNRSSTVLASKYKRPQTAYGDASRLRKSTNGKANNKHDNCKPSKKISSTCKEPSPARRNLTRKRNVVEDHVNDKDVSKHNNSNNNTINNNVHWTQTSPNNRSSQSPKLNYNSNSNVSNNYSPIRTVTNNISNVLKKRKNNSGKSSGNSIGVAEISKERSSVDKSDSFMVYRSGGTNEMDSNSEDEEKNNDEDEEEIDEEEIDEEEIEEEEIEEEEESMDDSVEESEEEEDAEVAAIAERAEQEQNVEQQLDSDSESSNATSGMSSNSTSSENNSSGNSDSDSSSSSDSESSSVEEIPAPEVVQKPVKKNSATNKIPPSTNTNNVKHRRASGSGLTSSSQNKLPTTRHFERPVYSPDVTAPVSTQISYRKRVEEYERNLKAGSVVAKCPDHKNCSKVLFENDQVDDVASGESDNSSDIASVKTTEKKKPEVEEGLDNADANEKIQSALAIALQPLDLVWARCKEGYSYPALIINPDMPVGFTQNGVAIPGPPREILEKRPKINSPEQVFLVLFFDHKRSWEWIIRSKLQQLGMDPSLDKERLMEIRKPSEKKAVRRAYEKAILHRCRVNGSRSVLVDNLGD